MQRAEIDYTSRISFTEQTPEMLIEKKVVQPLYEKAFLSTAEESCSAYSQNTTTWD